MMSVQPAQPAPQQSSPPPGNGIPADVVPSCSVCGRQDETLRIVTLPYVISVIVVTFNRSMAGLWCQRHRNLRLALAGSITAILGWIGIPFGLVFTPAALYKLARGGTMPVDPNVQMLKKLAEHMQKRGDVVGAARCLEEALKFSDDEDTRRRLSELKSKYALTLTGKETRTALPLVALLLGAPVIGACVGVLDSLITGLFSFDANQEVSIFLVILSWIPLVVGIFIAGIVLNSLLGWALSRYRVRSQILGMSLAAVSAGFAAYGVPTGRALTEFLRIVFAGPSLGAFAETVQMTGMVLTRGGARFLVDVVQMGELAGIIYVLILLVALLYFCASGLAAARSLVLQRQRIDSASPASSTAVAATEAPGWLALASALAGAALLVALFIHVPASGFLTPPSVQHAELAEQLYQQGDFAGAVAELEQAILFEPENGIIHSNLGWAYLQQGRFLEARQEFLAAIDLDELSADTYLGLGISHYALQDYEAAHSSLLQVLDANPLDETRAQAHYGLALISNMNGDLDLAIFNLEQAVRLDPADIDYKVNLGWARYHGSDYQGAVQTFQDVLRLDPDNVDAELGHAFAKFQLEEFAGAEASFEALLRMNLDDPLMNEVYLGLSLVYEAQNNLSDSAKYLEMSLALSPTVETRIKLIYILMGMGEFEAAVDQCDTILEDQPAWAAPTAIKAWMYFVMGETEIAESLLDSAQSLPAEDLDSIVALALASRHARKFPEAEAYILRALELAPENETLFFTLVYVLSSQAKYEEAMDVLEVWMEEGDASALAHASAGSVWIDQGDLDRSYEEYSTALAIEPESDVVHSGLSFIHFNRGLIDESLVSAREAIHLNPYSASGYKNLAFAYHAQGNLEQAIEAAQEALRLYPAYDEAHYILGVCFMEMGENEKAIESFERFLAFYYERAFVLDYELLARAYLEELQ